MSDRESESLEQHLRQLQGFHFGVEGSGTAAAAEALALVPAWLPEVERRLAGGSSLRCLIQRAEVAYSSAWKDWQQRASPIATALESLVGSIGEGGASSPAALGAMGSRFVNPDALATRLSSQRRESVSAERQSRLEKSLAVLRRGLEGRMTRRPLILCDPDLSALSADLPEGIDITVEERPCRSIVEPFEERANEVAELIAALRVARLELEQSYDPAVHDSDLVHFDWRSLHDAERPLLPSLLCVVSYPNAIGDELSALFQLLTSALPIQILVPVAPLASALDGEIDLAHLALSHRRSFVHQGSLAAADLLERGFDRALATPGAALHLIAGDELGEDGQPESPGAAVDARCHPLFVFDPGPSRASAVLELDGNQLPDQDWVTSDELSFTIAHLALLSPRGLRELAPVAEDLLPEPATAGNGPASVPSRMQAKPSARSSETLLPLGEWLSLTPEQTRRKLPFIHAANQEGDIVHLVASRRLALACIERLDHWRTLRRLADRTPATAPRALPSEQLPMLPDAQSDEPALHPDVERLRMAEQVVGRLMSRLLNDGPSA